MFDFTENLNSVHKHFHEIKHTKKFK